MSLLPQIRDLWLSVTDVALPLAEVRDRFLTVPGGEKRFGQLHNCVDHLHAVEESLYEYLEWRRDASGARDDIDRLCFMMCNAAIENGKTLLELATAEIDLKAVAR